MLVTSAASTTHVLLPAIESRPFGYKQVASFSAYQNGDAECGERDSGRVGRRERLVEH